MLIYFVHHVASRINVNTVINLVADDLNDAIERLTLSAPDDTPPQAEISDGQVLQSQRTGYVQRIDDAGLARWLAENGCRARLDVKPGDFVVAGAPVGHAAPSNPAVQGELADALGIGAMRSDAMDLVYPVRQLVEVAVRALSPGVNDPQTAMGALDRLGAALCTLAARFLPSGVRMADGRAVLARAAIDYAALTDAMFDAIRENADGSAEVLGHMLATLFLVAQCECAPERLAALHAHADRVAEDAARDVPNTSDRERIARAHADCVGLRRAARTLA